jgi:hypothetical protein
VGQGEHQVDVEGRCAGCRRHTPSLDAWGLCAGCGDTAPDVITGALQEAEILLTRADLATAMAATWPALADPVAVASLYLDQLLDTHKAEEISPGRYRLVPNLQDQPE